MSDEMRNFAFYKKAFTEYERDERHDTVAETRYWLDQYKSLCRAALSDFTSPQPTDSGSRKPLTEREIEKLVDQVTGEDWKRCYTFEEIFQVIEAVERVYGITGSEIDGAAESAINTGLGAVKISTTEEGQVKVENVSEQLRPDAAVPELPIVGWRYAISLVEGPWFLVEGKPHNNLYSEPLVRLSDAQAALQAQANEICALKRSSESHFIMAKNEYSIRIQLEQQLQSQAQRHAEEIQRMQSEIDVWEARSDSHLENLLVAERQVAELQKERGLLDGDCSVEELCRRLRFMADKKAVAEQERDELKTQLAYANDAAAKGKAGRDLGTALEESRRENEELKEELSWESKVRHELLALQEKWVKDRRDLEEKVYYYESTLYLGPGKVSLMRGNIANAITPEKVGDLAKENTELKAKLADSQTVINFLTDENKSLKLKLESKF